MSASFTARTPNGLFLGALADLAGTITFDEFNIAESATVVIKIEDPNFTDASTTNYRIGQIVTAIQEDILGIFNHVTGESITLKSLGHRPELIAKIKVTEGCLEFNWLDTINKVLEYTKSCTSEDKVKILRLLLASVAVGCTAWVACTGIEAWRDIELKKYDYAIEKLKVISSQSKSLEEVTTTLQENNRTPRAIAEHMTSSGTVTVGHGAPHSAQELQGKLKEFDKSQEDQNNKPYPLDRIYTVYSQDYEKQAVKIKIHGKTIWASTSSLLPEDKEQLKAVTDLAVDTEKPQRAELKIDVYVSDGKPTKADIVGIGSPRKTAITIYEALLDAANSPEENVSSRQLLLPIAS